MKVSSSELKECLVNSMNGDMNIIRELDDNASFELIGLDSIQFISFIIFLEDKYSIEFEDDDLLFSNADTISKMIEILKKY